MLLKAGPILNNYEKVKKKKLRVLNILIIFFFIFIIIIILYKLSIPTTHHFVQRMESEKRETDTKENKKTKNKNKENRPLPKQTQTETAMRYLPGGKSSWGWIRAVKGWRIKWKKKRQASNMLIKINKSIKNINSMCVNEEQ